MPYRRRDTVTDRPTRTDPHRRWRRLARRVVLPVSAGCLTIALVLTGYTRLAGEPANEHNPFRWSGDPVYVAGGSPEGTYTTCTIVPEIGERRRVPIPGQDSGLRLTAWFDGPARVSCGRSVSITSGWPSVLYPIASGKGLQLALAVLAAAAWWYGRGGWPRRNP